MLELNAAQTDADFADVFGFWYDIYVTEMGRHIDDVNTSHKHQTLYDPMATAGSLLVARHNNEVVGTVLSTPAIHPATEKYRQLYQLDALDTEKQCASAITTKLMVRPDQRRTRLPLRLFSATFKWSLRSGIEHHYIDCNDHLVKLFSKLGFEQHLPSLYHRDYGKVNSMHIEITDEAHLREVRSPLLPLLQRFKREQEQEQEQLLAPIDRLQPGRSLHHQQNRTRQATRAPAA